MVDFEELANKLEAIPCITQHADFTAVCLTEAVLEMMEALTRERRGYGVNEEWSNRYAHNCKQQIKISSKIL